MRWSDIPFDPPRATLRQFAGLWLAFFGGLAAWQFVAEGREAAGAALAALAVAVGSAGLAAPGLIRPVFVGWMVLVFPIGWVVSRALLAAMFYGVFTPVALVFRAIGRDPLERRRRPARASHWQARPAPGDPGRYLRQF